MTENTNKENSNTKEDIISPSKNEPKSKLDNQNDSEYLNLFCKDITKINNKDECGWTPLFRTVVSGILAATEALLNSGADPNIQTSMGETPLYQAVEMQKISHVNLLLQKGANPNIAQIDGLTPLHLAVNRQNILIIKELLKYKADPNTKNLLYEQTPLHFAIKNNVDPMILLILVQYNGNLTMKDKFGKRPLDYVSSEEMKKVIEKLKYENDKEKEKEIDNDEIYEKKRIKFNTPNKEIKWSESKMLSDSAKGDYDIKETQIDFNRNTHIILKEPGNYYQHFYKVKSGTINNEEAQAVNIRKRLFKEKEKYNKKLFNKSFFNSKYKNEKRYTDSANHNHINKLIFNKIKNNILKENNSKYKATENSSYKKIPINTTPSYKKDLEYYYNTLQNEEEKSVTSYKTFYDINPRKKQIHLNMPLMPLAKQIKYKKNFYLSEKDNKSTCINSDISTSTKKENTFQNKLNTNTFNDFNTISDTKKYSLIQRDSRNNKSLTNENSNTYNTDIKYNSINLSEEKNPFDQKEVEKRMINEYINKKKRLYIKPKITMNDSNSLDKKNSGYTFNIIHNNTVNNKNFFNQSNRNTKRINTSSNSLNSLANEKNNINSNFNTNNNIMNKKGPLRIKQFKLRKKMLNVKNLQIPFDKKKIPYYNRGTFSSCSNTYISNSITDSFYDSASNYYIRKKNTNSSSSANDSIILDKEKYPINDWLSAIDLSCYTNLFIHKKIYDLDKVINAMKKGKIKMTPKDIYKIGVKTPGHIFRIFVKLELDAGIIDKKIYDYIEKKKKEPKTEEINILNNSIYNICGCCSLKEKTSTTCTKKKSNNYDIDQWLTNINMIKYKQNFLDNGFDKFEYFFLQMFGSVPIDFNILKNSLNIESEKDRDLILLQLQNDVKYLAIKSNGLNKINMNKIPKIVKSNSGKIPHNKQNKEQDCNIF